MIKKIGILLLPAIIFLSGCASDPGKGNFKGISYIKDGEFTKPCLTVGDTKPDNYEIAQRLFTGYLEYRMSENVGLDQRIKEYKIVKIEAGQNSGTGFNFNVTYSILPFDGGAFIQAGNGVTNQSTGWIENKFYVVSVTEKDGKFVMNSWGTGL